MSELTPTVASGNVLYDGVSIPTLSFDAIGLLLLLCYNVSALSAKYVLVQRS